MKSNKLKVIGKFSRRGIIFQELHTSRKIVVAMFFSIYEVEDGPKPVFKTLLLSAQTFDE